MAKSFFVALVLSLTLTSLVGCYNEAPYGDKKESQEETSE